MKEIMYEGKVGFRTGGIRERKDSGLLEFRTKGIQERRVQNRRYGEQERCWATGDIHERSDTNLFLKWRQGKVFLFNVAVSFRFRLLNV